MTKHKHAHVLEAIANGETQFESMHPKSGEWIKVLVPNILLSLTDPISDQFQFRVKEKFKRELRYSVFKYKDLDKLSSDLRSTAYGYLDALSNLVYPVECVVVESDWKCYEDVWKLVEDEANEIP